MSQTEVLDLTTLSNGFPKQVVREIVRDNLLDSIDTFFSNDHNVIVLVGRSDIGKTTLLSQFCRRYPLTALSFFVKRQSRSTYDMYNLRLSLYHQAQLVLGKNKFDEVDEQKIMLSMYFLRRHSKRTGSPLYFVIDGLDELPEGDMLPLLDLIECGDSAFNYILSTKDDGLLQVLQQKLIPYKTFDIPSLSKEEEVAYLADLGLKTESLDEVRQVCRGIPGKLASIRRSLGAGLTEEQLVNKLPQFLHNLFLMEWQQIDKEDHLLLQALALVAFGNTYSTVGRIADVLNVPDFDIEKRFTNLEFMSISPNGEVSFDTESFREFVGSQLQELRQETRQNLIKFYLQQPHSDESLSNLPFYLQEAGELQELETYLSPENFKSFISVSKSLTVARKHALLGLTAAEKLEHDQELMRFGMYQSILEDTSRSQVWVSEIAARIALDDYEHALALAQSTIIVEDKLHMLAIIAKKRKEQNRDVEAELVEQIRTLYKSIDSEIGARGVDIASDLIYSCPDLAIDLIQRITRTSDDENALDWALARLSYASLTASNTPDEFNERMADLASKIDNPLAHNFSVAARLLTQDLSAAEVIEEAKKLGTATDQLYLLRAWASGYKVHKNARLVIEYALNLFIQTTEYSPNATLFRDLARQLPHIEDHEDLRKLISVFDKQVELVKDVGPSVDYVATQLSMAEAELNLNRVSARTRVVDIFCYTMDIEDLAVRANCLAHIMSFMAVNDLQSEFEESEGLPSWSEDELNSNIQRLLVVTAEHNDATDPVLTRFSASLPDNAYQIAKSLNTETRRNKALVTIVDAALNVPVKEVKSSYLIQVIDAITDPYLRNPAILNVIERLTDSEEVLTWEEMHHFLPIIVRAGEITSSEKRCKAYCLVYKLLAPFSQAEAKTEQDAVVSNLSKTWESIDALWIRLNVGYRIAESLAPHSPDLAREYLKKTEDLRENSAVDSIGTTYLQTLFLGLRAFIGLVRHNQDVDDDFERLTQLIKLVPSYGFQSILHSELAMRYYRLDRINDTRRVVTEFIQPLLDRMTSYDEAMREELIVECAPALYIAFPVYAREIIADLPPFTREEAYYRICSFIVKKFPPHEPYQTSFSASGNLDRNECLNILELVTLMETDVYIYSLIEKIASSIANRKTNISRQQAADLAKKIEDIIIDKFPNPRFIQHAGYKVAAKAQLYRIREERNWQPLVDEGRKITNAADRAYVLGLITSCMSRRQHELRARTVREAEQIITTLPVLKEKIEQYENLAKHVLPFDSSLSKKYVKTAMELSRGGDPDSLHSCQRSLIDLAHRIDPNLASSLISAMDDDPARFKARRQLKEDVDVRNLKDNMSQSEDSGHGASKSLYPRAATMSLAHLNAGLTSSADPMAVRKAIRIVSDMPLSQSYPVFSWGIENIVQRATTRPNLVPLVRQLFEATMLAAELSLSMISTRTPSSTKSVERFGRVNSIVVRSGERPDAIKFIQTWLEQKQVSYVKIADPYFGPSELEFVKLIQDAQPDCVIRILTSLQHQQDVHISRPFSDSYREYWRLHVSVQDPPATQIVIIGDSNGASPVHDRWWVTMDGGLRFGTSLNTLGLHGGKDSDISHLSADEARERELKIDPLIQQIQQFDANGNRLKFESFNLWE